MLISTFGSLSTFDFREDLGFIILVHYKITYSICMAVIQGFFNV